MGTTWVNPHYRWTFLLSLYFGLKDTFLTGKRSPECWGTPCILLYYCFYFRHMTLWFSFFLSFLFCCGLKRASEFFFWLDWFPFFPDCFTHWYQHAAKYRASLLAMRVSILGWAAGLYEEVTERAACEKASHARTIFKQRGRRIIRDYYFFFSNEGFKSLKFKRNLLLEHFLLVSLSSMLFFKKCFNNPFHFIFLL